jgi:hypothetical protein
MSALPACSGQRAQPGDYALGHAACRQARLNAPTWQEIAKAIRPHLPGLPPPGLEAYARALLGEAEEISYMTFLPAPYTHRPREVFQRALLAGAVEALKRGAQVAAVQVKPNGTYEVVDVCIPPIFARQHSADALPDLRPALRLVKDERQPPEEGGMTAVNPVDDDTWTRAALW